MNTCDLGIYLQALNIVCFTNMLLSFVQASWELPGTRESGWKPRAAWTVGDEPHAPEDLYPWRASQYIMKDRDLLPSRSSPTLPRAPTLVHTRLLCT